jgi:hypothetical protein
MEQEGKIKIVTRTPVSLTDPEFFCNKSWTVSFNMNTKSWTSFHSYIPNWYIGDNNFFYSGLNNCCSDAEGDFVALVANVDRTITTTTTAPPQPRPTTSTSTTLFTIDCTIIGEAFAVDCLLEGTGIITVPPTTTTTLCQRPSNLRRFYFSIGYTFTGESEVITKNSFNDACNGLTLTRNTYGQYEVNVVTARAESLNVGSIVYYNANSFDCTLVSDGWYYTQEGQFDSFVYHIVNGVVASIDSCDCGTTTSTTTLALEIPECCGVLYNTVSDIYYDMTNLNVSNFESVFGIIMTPDYLWSVLNSEILQWDITLSPFTATYNKSIAFPVGFTTTASGVAIDNENIIMVNTTSAPQDVVSMDITGLEGILTTQFSLQTDRAAQGNMLLTIDDKLIVINQDTVSSDYYLTQYDYATGILEVDVNIGDVNVLSLYECNCSIFIKTESGIVYTIDSSDNIILVGDLNMPAISSTQSRYCVPVSLINNANITTTTTTTVTPTTTTTSSSTTTTTTTIP